MTDERQKAPGAIPLPAGTLYTAGLELTVEWLTGYLSLCFWAGIADDGTRRMVGLEGNCGVDPRPDLPDVDTIYLIHGNPFAAVRAGGYVSTWPTPTGGNLYIDYDWDVNAEPVNQIPHLEGWTDTDGVFHEGWYSINGRFAHEAIAFDPDQIKRLHHASHSADPSAALSDSESLRARLGLKYGRLLTGWAEGQLTAWAAHDTGDPLGHALYKVELPDIMAMMRAICDGECENPHWVLDFALNIVPDPWEDALNEQSPIQQPPQSPVRRVYLPRVVKNERGWLPGDIGTPAERFDIHQTIGNPVRYWETLIRRCATAAERFRERFAVRRQLHI